MTGIAPTADRYTRIDRLFRRKQLSALVIPFVILVYLTYIFFDFEVPALIERANMNNARILVADSYSYKTHVTRDVRSGRMTVAIEGETKSLYPADRWPDWVRSEGSSVYVNLGRGQQAEFVGNQVILRLPDGAIVQVEATPSGIQATYPPDIDLRISESSTRFVIFLDGARLSATRNRLETFRYFWGWEMFWFAIDSPFFERPFTELVSLAFSSERLTPGRSNMHAMVHDFWNNRIWRHSEVAWALFETLLMAFIGTFGAALIALPLAFLSAVHFSPSRTLRFGLRRVFDFLRGVDGLIWTIVLSRAFGPGPLTGSLAILLTEIGSFGKLFSEALENSDRKQIEGIHSTGANAVQRYRFGVIPQLMPVLLSQVLYYFESNTRSATIIGAIVGGGIGLFLTQAIITQKDWEQVAYYIVLIVLMVFVIDSLSGWIRQKLIRGH
jgi:phosphonate transport system permease protein